MRSKVNKITTAFKKVKMKKSTSQESSTHQLQLQAGARDLLEELEQGLKDIEGLSAQEKNFALAQMRSIIDDLEDLIAVIDDKGLKGEIEKLIEQFNTGVGSKEKRDEGAINLSKLTVIRGILAAKNEEELVVYLRLQGGGAMRDEGSVAVEGEPEPVNPWITQARELHAEIKNILFTLEEEEPHQLVQVWDMMVEKYGDGHDSYINKLDAREVIGVLTWPQEANQDWPNEAPVQKGMIGKPGRFQICEQIHSGPDLLLDHTEDDRLKQEMSSIVDFIIETEQEHMDGYIETATSASVAAEVLDLFDAEAGSDPGSDPDDSPRDPDKTLVLQISPQASPEAVPPADPTD